MCGTHIPLGGVFHKHAAAVSTSLSSLPACAAVVQNPAMACKPHIVAISNLSRDVVKDPCTVEYGLQTGESLRLWC